MSGIPQALNAHLATGITTLCRAWAIRRKDGVSFGFTDHDLPLSFEGIEFKADTGMSAASLAQSTGLSVDNTEAIGALSDAAVTELDIDAGRFDGAEVLSWLVNWSAPDQRWMQFRGSIGEIRRGSGAFTAELRGLTDGLNRPVGRVYQKPCSAVLGDTACGVNTMGVGYFAERELITIEDNRRFRWPELDGFDPAWFERGRFDVISGASAGLWGHVKRDVSDSKGRLIELWEPIRGTVLPGDQVRLTTGCDKRMETCRLKFNNIQNFQGFPDLPGDDWLASVPKSSGANSGGSLR